MLDYLETTSSKTCKTFWII